MAVTKTKTSKETYQTIISKLLFLLVLPLCDILARMAADSRIQAEWVNYDFGE